MSKSKKAAKYAVAESPTEEEGGEEKQYATWAKLLVSKDVSKLKEGCRLVLAHPKFATEGSGLANLMKILVHQVLLDPKKSKWQGVNQFCFVVPYSCHVSESGSDQNCSTLPCRLCCCVCRQRFPLVHFILHSVLTVISALMLVGPRSAPWKGAHLIARALYCEDDVAKVFASSV